MTDELHLGICVCLSWMSQ